MSLYGAKRSPFPYHIKVGGTGLLIGAAEQGKPQLSSSKIQDIAQVAPPDYSYGGSSPISDRDEPYQQLTLGMGMSLQQEWNDQRYNSANGVDCSVWPWLLGPEINTYTPGPRDTTVGITQLFELGTSLYAANGRYVLIKAAAADTWSVAKDFGAGEAILNVCVFQSNFDGTQRAFFALQTGVAQWTSNGTTYTAMATFHALAFTVIGREFWWADDTNRLRKCDTNADPTNEANYTSLIFRAGDKSSAITSLLLTSGGTLIIAKTDGLYTLDASGQDHELLPFLRFADESRNGKIWGTFENGLYVAYGNSLGRIDADLSWTSVGPDDLASNSAGITGRVSAFAGLGTMFAYSALYDRDTNTGYLMKFGAWVALGVKGPRQTTLVTALGSQGTGEPVHIDAWHGSLSVPFAGRAIQHLFVSGIDAPSQHTRTFIGFSDGAVGWMINPCSPNPAACSTYRYFVGDGWVDLPTWDGTYHASVKSLRHLSVTGSNLNASNYVTVDYRLDPKPSDPWVSFPNVFDSSVFETATMPTSAACTLAQFRVHLHNTANTSSPLVSAVSIGHALRPKRYMQVELNILCADGLVRRDGVPMRIGRRQIQRVVEQAVDNPGAVVCTLPDESVQELSFTDYSISQSFDEIGRQWRGSLTVKAVQWETVTTGS